jgi:hypothetical protein
MYGLKKMCNIWKTIYTKFYIRFQHHRPFAQILASQNSKGKYESRKILDYVKKIIKIDFFKDFLIYYIVSSTF